MIDRRSCLAANVAAFWPERLQAEGRGTPGFLTRGVVLVPEDLTLADWPERARRAGLTTIGIHHQNSPRAIIDWIKPEPGRGFLEACGERPLKVEYELQAIKEFLPRHFFEKNP